MLKTLQFYILKNKWLMIAVIISFTLHALLLTNASISFPSEITNYSLINMRLIKTLPEKKASLPDIKQVQVKPKPKKITKKATSPIPTEDNKAIASPNIKELANNELASNNDSKIQPSENEVSDNEKTSVMDTTELAETDETDETDESLPRVTTSADSNTHTSVPYTYIETQFDVTRGDNTGLLGVTQITFKMEARDNTYQLTSVTEPKGLASLFLGKLEQSSIGHVTEKGLQPSAYTYQYSANSDKNQHAELRWADSVVEMTTKKGMKSEPLPESTQDFLSFMYQFMFEPPLNTMQLTMTNGKYLRTYTYSFEGEEAINTKLGSLNTLHLLKSGDNLEKTEIWLALDYQNIPVKIRKTEKNGEVIEQVVSNISTTLTTNAYQ